MARPKHYIVEINGEVYDSNENHIKEFIEKRLAGLVSSIQVTVKRKSEMKEFGIRINGASQ